MLITFKSKSSADVLMLQDNAQPILDLLHKSPARGIITAAEAAGAMATLEQEVVASRQRQEPAADTSAVEKEDDDKLEEAKVQRVDFGARAFPLMEMLRSASANGNDIVWGV
ncbi:hypothetical protein ACFDR9_003327 [Janthinobacterium sp. CG_23.3]|uniref:DUF1840 domain-containing protein n=1 Tax=Janthinobacterium sp. CG_23.3 TaxID=3349634 RepID=UPI0038D50B49